MYDSVLGRDLLKLQTKLPAKIKTFQRISKKKKRKPMSNEFLWSFN